MSPIIEVLKETLRRSIQKHDIKTIEKVLLKSHKGDIAEVFKYLSKEERVKIFSILYKINPDKAVNVFTDLDDLIKIEIIRSIHVKDAVDFILRLPTPEIASIIENIPEDIKNAVLENLKGEEKEELKHLLSEGEDTVASLLQEDYIYVLDVATVEEVINKVKEYNEDREIIYIYIVDEKKRLVGVISLKDLIMYPSNIMIKDIMKRDLIFLNINDTKEDAIEMFKRYDLYALPAVDEEGVLQGVVYIEDIINVISEKTTEDFFKMAGAKEEELFYTDKTFKIAKLRLPWLLIATVGEFITAVIISLFDYTISEFVQVVFFLPMVAALSGNISSQAAIITARGLKEGRLTENSLDYLFTVFRELKIAIIIGIIIGILVGVVASLWISNHILGIIVAIALFFSIIFAGLIGSLVPFIMYKLEKDPTLATGPLSLTLTDIIGISIYLIVATFFIHYLKL
ncbi:magnesium transporter [Sulfurihydrogenibium sp.]|uniref:magnesium transporter n=1 Tax=Sulfurihydrogenibium sp. TaxID=2053621 RepID=UPI0026300B49|nr:magnesium transporter [Sulfurihydrogenibium sp.]